MADWHDYVTSPAGTYTLSYKGREVEFVNQTAGRAVVFYKSTTESALFAVPLDAITIKPS